MLITMLSMGTPMICMGDEVLRTQNGNNNAYCQDNELSYLNWDHTPMQEEMFQFTKALIKYSNVGQNVQRNIIKKRCLEDALRSAKIQWHGTKPFQPDWSDMSHSIGFLLYYPEEAVYAYIFVNAFWKDLKVEIPPVPGQLKKHWYQFVNTALGNSKDVSRYYMSTRYKAGDIIKVKDHSVVMLLCPTA